MSSTYVSLGIVAIKGHKPVVLVVTNDPDIATIACRMMTTKLEESLSNLNEELAPTFDIETRISGKDQGRINAV